MKCNPSRWLWGLIPLALLGWATFHLKQPRIEADLAVRATEALRKAGQAWANVSMDGRDATITGLAETDGAPKAALDIVRGVWGIRTVRLKTDLSGTALSGVGIGPRGRPDDAAARVADEQAQAAAEQAKAEAEASRRAREQTQATIEAQRDAERAALAAEQAEAARRVQQAAEEEAARKAEAEAEARAAAQKAREDAEAEAARKAQEDAEAVQEAEAEARAAALKAQQEAAAEAARQAAEAAARQAAEEAAARARETNEATKACERRLTEAAESGVILFSRAMADIDAESSRTLTRLAEIINACPGTRIEIEGHTDSEGTDERNQALSDRRAHAVVDSLVQAGVARDRLLAVGHGASRPAASNGTPEGMARNRRIEFKVFVD